jgi:PTH1 family peptidyl-tRNA hydrolase
MNLSGQAVKLLADFYKIPPADIWILHDELDLPLGKLRISIGSGPAGHNGVKSIIGSLGTKDFVRFRLGIAPEKKGFFSSLAKTFTSGKKLVLQKFSLDETRKIEEAKETTKNALLTALKENLAKAQTEFNK